MADFENTCVPKSQREAAFTIAALHQWEMDVNDDRCEASAEEVGLQSILFFFLMLIPFLSGYQKRWTAFL